MKKETIIYIFDPLCGWCYGFSGTIVDLFNKRKDEFRDKITKNVEEQVKKK